MSRTAQEDWRKSYRQFRLYSRTFQARYTNKLLRGASQYLILFIAAQRNIYGNTDDPFRGVNSNMHFQLKNFRETGRTRFSRAAPSR